MRGDVRLAGMRYIRVYADDAGLTRFEDCDLAFTSADFAPPGTVFLLEDTSPPGHGTKILEDAVLAVVRV
jgi:hypothetical protein